MSIAFEAPGNYMHMINFKLLKLLSGILSDYFSYRYFVAICFWYE